MLARHETIRTWESNSFTAYGLGLIWLDKLSDLTITHIDGDGVESNAALGPPTCPQLGQPVTSASRQRDAIIHWFFNYRSLRRQIDATIECG